MGLAHPQPAPPRLLDPVPDRCPDEGPPLVYRSQVSGRDDMHVPRPAQAHDLGAPRLLSPRRRRNSARTAPPFAEVRLANRGPPACPAVSGVNRVASRSASRTSIATVETAVAMNRSRSRTMRAICALSSAMPIARHRCTETAPRPGPCGMESPGPGSSRERSIRQVYAARKALSVEPPDKLPRDPVNGVGPHPERDIHRDFHNPEHSPRSPREPDPRPAGMSNEKGSPRYPARSEPPRLPDRYSAPPAGRTSPHSVRRRGRRDSRRERDRGSPGSHHPGSSRRCSRRESRSAGSRPNSIAPSRPCVGVKTTTTPSRCTRVPSRRSPRPALPSRSSIPPGSAATLATDLRADRPFESSCSPGLSCAPRGTRHRKPVRSPLRSARRLPLRLSGARGARLNHRPGPGPGPRPRARVRSRSPGPHRPRAPPAFNRLAMLRARPATSAA